MIKSAEGGAGLLHKISKPTAWRGEGEIPKTEVQDLNDKPMRNEELKNLEEEMLQGKYRSGVRWLSSQSSAGFGGKQEEKWWNSWRRWNSAGDGATSLHNDVLLNPEKCVDRASHSTHAYDDSLV